VACGETLRRLAGKAAWEPVKEGIKARLEPIQVGVGTSMGAEKVIHRVRAWMGAQGGSTSGEAKVLAMLDLSNAFNAIDRSAFLQGVRDLAPGLAPFSDGMYGGNTWLVLDGELIGSERGIQQGDPLGPGLFGMGIQGAVERATSKVRARYGEGSIFSSMTGWRGGRPERCSCGSSSSRRNSGVWGWTYADGNAS